MTLKDLIKKEVKRKTQRQLAIEIGVSQGTINNILAGQIPRNMPTLKKISDYFQVGLTELVFPNAEIVAESSISYGDLQDRGGPAPTKEQKLWKELMDKFEEIGRIQETNTQRRVILDALRLSGVDVDSILKRNKK